VLRYAKTTSQQDVNFSTGPASPPPPPLRCVAAQVACALFGIVAVDTKHGPMMRSYSWLVTYLLMLDVVWHHFWAERLLRNYTGVREENEMWWGLAVHVAVYP
jgi:hypothetical protein